MTARTAATFTGLVDPTATTSGEQAKRLDEARGSMWFSEREFHAQLAGRALLAVTYASKLGNTPVW
jgi:hypothetical protein